MWFSCTNKQLSLQAETSEDLTAWKEALEEALANAPSASNGIGQNGVLKNDQPDGADAAPTEQCKFLISSTAFHVYEFSSFFAKFYEFTCAF